MQLRPTPRVHPRRSPPLESSCRVSFGVQSVRHALETIQDGRCHMDCCLSLCRPRPTPRSDISSCCCAGIAPLGERFLRAGPAHAHAHRCVLTEHARVNDTLCRSRKRGENSNFADWPTSVRSCRRSKTVGALSCTEITYNTYTHNLASSNCRITTCWLHWEHFPATGTNFGGASHRSHSCSPAPPRALDDDERSPLASCPGRDRRPHR
jgi:hypothetical protein